MISINQLTISFGGFDLFKNVSFLINSRDRIGLVGKNGAGKTTLLKAINGDQGYDQGQVNIPKELKIGYLPQQMKIADSTTVIEETKKAFKELNELEDEIEKINHQISERTDYESEGYQKIINKLTELNQRFEILGGSDKEGNIEQTLIGLGFTRKDFNRETKEFSGGWRMRIEIAKLLLQRPEILLLDEPTNHLDIESIQWLEEFLKNYPGAVIIVSHDRRFLDTVTNRTIEILLGSIHDYKVSYSKYEVLRKERREQQIAAYNNQQKEIQDTERFIERFRYKNTKATQVQSRIKHLEKLEKIELEDEDTSSIHFKFPPAPHSGNLVIETKAVTKRFGDLTVFENIDMIVEKGEKISFVGKNGEGKTTMSRIFMDELDYKGHYKLGHNVKIGYYAQNQTELLNDNKTVFETIDDIAVGEVRTKTRDILGSFLFQGEDIDKKISVLSGGEKSRLALACMLLEPVNLLILDEPTNHLDMRSKEILKKALLKFDGTLIIVSHDRDFLDGLTDKVYEFRNKKIREHLGGINEFLRKRKLENLQDLNRKNQQKKIENNKEVSDNKLSYLERKEFDKELRKIKKKVTETEEKISTLEKEIAKIDEQMADPEKIKEFTPEDYKKYDKLKNDLETEMENWEKYTAEHDEFEQKRS